MNTQLLSRSPADCRVEQSYPCAFTALVAGLLLLVAASAARAQPVDGIQPGEAFVSQFSGTVEQAGRTVIDPSGIVARSIDIRRPGAIPSGQHLSGLSGRVNVMAQDVGQVFGIAFDDAEAPNIYLTATSAFGLHRTSDNRDWMAGMWGSEGGPGSVWRLSAKDDYRPELFADITLDGRLNTGAALGNIAYDRHNRQLYVSDLETGMIHRLSVSDGQDLGRYDHGTQGRVRFVDAQTGGTQNLEAISFDPTSSARLTDCPAGTVTSHASCWNFADFRRRVWGLAVRRDASTNEVRLYYSVWGSNGFGDPAWFTAGDERRVSVWSVGIAADGAFDSNDVRREFLLPEFFTDPAAIASRGPSHGVSDIAFPKSDTQAVMLVAERGTVRNLGLEAAAPFAHPHEARVIRYERDAQGVWQLSGRYDVGYADRRTLGQPFIRANGAGGVDFGPGYNDAGEVDLGQQDQFAWMTGDGLCSEAGPCFDAEARSHSHGLAVHGIQGTNISRVDELAPAAARQPYPATGYATPPETPQSSYMVAAGPDQDRNARDATKIGDVEVYQPVSSPEIQPAEGPWEGPWEEAWPWPVPEDDYPPLPPPPAGEAWPELAVTKTAPAECERGGECTYTIALTNNGGGTYAGPLYLLDTPPADATYVSASAGWTCEQRPPGGIGCRYEPTTLTSGQSVSLTLTVRLPGDIAADVTEVWNCVFIVWPRALDGAAQIRAVEAALLLLGHDPGPVDGVLDAAAQTAIDDYRAAVGLPAGGLDELLLEMLFPGSSGMVGDGFPGNDRDCASTRITGPPVEPAHAFDLGIEKSGPAECEPGGECTFEVTVTNRGTEPYEGDLVFADALSTPEPGSAVIIPVPTLVGFEGAGWTCTAHPAGATCRFAGASLAAGASQSVRITWQVPDDYARDQIRNCAGLAWLEMGHENDDDATNDSACSETGIAPPAFDLAVEKSGPAECERGGECTFEVTVTNRGTEPYEGDLVFADALSTPEPGSAVIVPVPTLVGFEGAGWICTAHPAGATCRFADASLAAGASQSVRITWQVPADYARDQIRNCAGLAWLEMGHENDEDATNDSACSETGIALPAFDIALEKSGPAYCAVGSECTFDVTVTNHGTDPYAGDLVFTEALSTPEPGSALILPVPDLVGFEGDGWNCTAHPAGVTCRHPGATLAAGASETVRITWRVPDPYEQDQIRNCAGLAWPEMGHANDDLAANDSACSETSIGLIAIIFDLIIEHFTECERGALCQAGFRVRNGGEKPFSGAIGIRGSLTPALPIQSVDGAKGGWSCEISGNSYQCQPRALRLAPGNSEVMLLTLPIPKEFKGSTIQHDMQIVWPDEKKRDPIPSTDVSSGIIDILDPSSPTESPIDLVVKKRGPTSCSPGANCTYTITVANQGPGTYRGPLFLNDTYPGYVFDRFVRASAEWNCVDHSGAADCRHDVVTLRERESVTLTLTIRLGENVGDLMENRAAGGARNCAWLRWPGLYSSDERHRHLWVERALAMEGYLVTSDIDGEIEVADRRAIRAYQAANGLAPTGAINEDLWRSLFDGIAGITGDRNSDNDRMCIVTRLFETDLPVCDAGWIPVTRPRAKQLVSEGWQTKQVRRSGRSIMCAKKLPAPTAQPLPSQAAPDLGITKVPTQQSCLAGKPCSFALVTVNGGQGTFSGPLQITDILTPAGARLTQSGPAPWICRSLRGRVRCNHPATQLAPGESNTLSLAFTTNRNATGTLRNCATIDWSGAAKVRAVQRALSQSGFPAGAPDGKAGARTRKAVRDYQKRVGLPVTGRIDNALMRRLFGEWANGDARADNDRACTDVEIQAPDLPPVVAPPPRCEAGWTEMSRERAKILSRRGWQVKRVTRSGRTIWCAQRRTTPPVTPTCTGGRTRNDQGQCVCPSSRPNWTGQRCVACTGGTRWNAQKRACIKPTPTCTSGRIWSPRKNTCVCPANKPHWTGQRCIACTGGTRWNAQKRACIKPAPTCTSGRIWSPRKNTCVCPANKPHWTGRSCIACTGGTRWNAQKRACIKPTPTCTSGRIWSPRKNTCVCPANRPHWTGKSCVACTRGTRWNAQKRACVRPTPTCTGGRVLKQGKCVCPPSRPVWNGRTCTPRARPQPQAACPSGWVKVSREKAKALVRQGWQIKQVGSNLCARRRTQPRPQLR